MFQLAEDSHMVTIIPYFGRKHVIIGVYLSENTYNCGIWSFYRRDGHIAGSPKTDFPPTSSQKIFSDRKLNLLLN